MSTNNPHARQMADESMVRTLAAQADAIWPQEKELMGSYPQPGLVLDLACGTGEITRRMNELWPNARYTGLDIDRNHLVRAGGLAGSLEAGFIQGDVFQLPFPDGVFDLTVARHIHQAIPNAGASVKELVRVTKHGGHVHVLAEDYAMMFFDDQADAFWVHGPREFAKATGTDLLVGRKMPEILRSEGIEEITVNYAVVDTLRVPRETFAAIWEAWRDGYSEAIVELTHFKAEEVAGFWASMIAQIRDPKRYAAWLVPLIHGVKP